MQPKKAKGKCGLPALFIPIQIMGVAIVGLGWLGLRPWHSTSGIVATLALAGPVTSWVIVALGIAVLVANGTRLVMRANNLGSPQAVSSVSPVDPPFSKQLVRKNSEVNQPEPTILLPPIQKRIGSS